MRILIVQFLLFNIIAQSSNSPIRSEHFSKPYPGSILTQQRNPDSVTLTVTVTNKQGDYIKGLNRSDFKIFEGKSPLEITSLDYGDEPVSVGIVYDESQSMRDAKRFASPKVVREALDHFIQTSNRSNSYFLVTFSDQPQLTVDWTRDRETLFKGVEAAPAKGNSAFYDACQMALEKLRTGEYRKRAMLLISDGLDTRSRLSYRDLRQLVITSDVLLYAIPTNGKVNRVRRHGKVAPFLTSWLLSPAVERFTRAVTRNLLRQLGRLLLSYLGSTESPSNLAILRRVTSGGN